MSRNHFITLGLLLVLPAAALLRLNPRIGWYWVVGYLLLVSLATFFVYRHDKKRAEKDGWRTKEGSLHMMEAIGGWPGAFVAQHVLRHKCSKKSFRVVFWSIVGLYQYIAFDYLIGWRIIGGLAGLVRGGG